MSENPSSYHVARIQVPARNKIVAVERSRVQGQLPGRHFVTPESFEKLRKQDCDIYAGEKRNWKTLHSKAEWSPLGKRDPLRLHSGLLPYSGWDHSVS